MRKAGRRHGPDVPLVQLAELDQGIRDHKGGSWSAGQFHGGDGGSLEIVEEATKRIPKDVRAQFGLQATSPGQFLAPGGPS